MRAVLWTGLANPAELKLLTRTEKQVFLKHIAQYTSELKQVSTWTVRHASLSHPAAHLVTLQARLAEAGGLQDTDEPVSKAEFVGAYGEHSAVEFDQLDKDCDGEVSQMEYGEHLVDHSLDWQCAVVPVHIRECLIHLFECLHRVISILSEIEARESHSTSKKRLQRLHRDIVSTVVRPTAEVLCSMSSDHFFCGETNYPGFGVAFSGGGVRASAQVSTTGFCWPHYFRADRKRERGREAERGRQRGREMAKRVSKHRISCIVKHNAMPSAVVGLQMCITVLLSGVRSA